MALCELCGSIRIVRARPEGADRLVALFTSKRPFVCRRCGWRGRRNWTDDELKQLLDYGAGDAGPDPALAGLDGERRSRERRKHQAGHRGRSNAEGEATRKRLDLGALNPPPAESRPPGSEGGDDRTSTSRPKHRRTRSRRKRSRRRQIVATVAAAALVMFFVAMLGLTGSCSGGSEAF